MLRYCRKRRSFINKTADTDTIIKKPVSSGLYRASYRLSGLNTTVAPLYTENCACPPPISYCSRSREPSRIPFTQAICSFMKSPGSGSLCPGNIVVYSDPLFSIFSRVTRYSLRGLHVGSHSQTRALVLSPVKRSLFSLSRRHISPAECPGA